MREQTERVLALLQMIAAEPTGPLARVLAPGPELAQLTDELDAISGELMDRGYIDGAAYSRLYDLVRALRDAEARPWDQIRELAAEAASHVGAWVEMFRSFGGRTPTT